MLESKRHVPFGYILNLNDLKPLPVFLKKWYRELLYLLLPEDSTCQEGGRKKNVPGQEVSSTRSTIKLVFWAVISIIISLAIGQLR